MSLSLIQQSTFKAKWGHTPVLVPDYSISCPIHAHCIGKDPLLPIVNKKRENKGKNFLLEHNNELSAEQKSWLLAMASNNMAK